MEPPTSTTSFSSAAITTTWSTSTAGASPSPEAQAEFSPPEPLARRIHRGQNIDPDDESFADLAETHGIDERTSIPLWRGERPDYHYIISVVCDRQDLNRHFREEAMAG